MHTLLKAAHDAAPEKERPLPPYHGGVDANPQLGSFGFGGVAIFMAEALSETVTKTDRAVYIQKLGVARDIYSRHAQAKGTDVKSGTKTKLRVLSKEERRDLEKSITYASYVTDTTRDLSPALAASTAAVAAAYDIEMQNGGPYVTAALRDVMGRIVPELPQENVRRFLIDLDRVLLREELRALLARRRDPRCEEVTACVWRAASTEKRARQGRASGAQVTHWIGAMKSNKNSSNNNNGYLLLWKVGARWEVLTGSRDEVLATVPDALMESATNAAFASKK